MSADMIVGTWHGSKNIPFLASGKCVITFHEDGTAVVNGSVYALGQNYLLNNESFTWENLGGGHYLGKYDKHQLGFQMNDAGSQVMAVFNVYKLGLMTSPLYNQDITITLYR